MNTIYKNNAYPTVKINTIDRGIKLILISCIIKYYKIIKNKTVIIDNIEYRNLMKRLFPELTITPYTTHSSDNFYFNIRSIIKSPCAGKPIQAPQRPPAIDKKRANTTSRVPFKLLTSTG